MTEHTTCPWCGEPLPAWKVSANVRRGYRQYVTCGSDACTSLQRFGHPFGTGKPRPRLSIVDWTRLCREQIDRQMHRAEVEP